MHSMHVWGAGARGASARVRAVLPAAIIGGLKEQVTGVNELLRHFWACWPLTSAARRRKAARVGAALEAIYQHSEAMRHAAAPEHRMYVAQLLRASTAALDTALDKYDREVKGSV
jgi:transcription initiation factor TFIIH subunit 1